MASEVLELQIRVSGVAQGSAQIDRLTRSASAATSALRFMRNALVVASSIRLFGGIFEVIDSFQRLQNQLRLVTGDIGDAAAAFDQVYRIALQTRSPLEAVNILYARLVRVGGLLNLTYGQVAEVTRAVSESFQIAGATADETRNAIIQLTQGLNLGILRGQDLRSVVEFNPRLAQVFADKLSELGLATDKYGKKIQLAGSQLYSFVTAHKNILTSKIAMDALLGSVQKLDHEFLLATPTIGQLFTNIKTTFTYLSGILLKNSGLLDDFNNGLRFIGDHLGSILGVIVAVGAALATWLVIDLITAQFAKLFGLGGILGVLLAPIKNIAIGFYNIYRGITLVVSATISAARFLYNAVTGVAQFFATAIRGAFEASLAVGRFAVSMASAVGSATTGAISAVGSIIRTALVSAINVAISAAASLGIALIGFIAEALVLTPLLAVGLTAIGGALTYVSAGVAGVSGTIEDVANNTLSWHDIFNSLIRVVLVGFDIIRNHLPLVMQFLAEQWNNMVAVFTSGIANIVSGINDAVQALVRFGKLLSNILPVAGAFGGAALGSVLGPVGAGVGAAAGFLTGLGGQAKFDATLDSIANSMQGFSDKATEIATDAGKKSGHQYTQALFDEVRKSFASHNGDFVQALDLISQGVSLQEVAKRTGVSLGDLSGVSSIINKFVPSHGKLSEQGTEKDLTNRINSEIAAIFGFVKQVSPYAEAIQKVAEAHKLFTKAAKDGIDVDGLLSKAGLTRAELYKRLARETDGVGNATTKYDDQIKLLTEDLGKGYITQQEFAKATLDARIALLQTKQDLGSGEELAFLEHQRNLLDQNKVAVDVLQQAFSRQDAINRFKVGVQAITDAFQKQEISARDAADSIRDLYIEVLNTQTDALSGFQRGLLQAQKSMNDFATTASQAVTQAFDDMTDALVNFFQTGKLDIKTLGDDLLRNLDKLAVQQVFTGPISNALGFDQSGNGGLFGGGGILSTIFGGSGLGGILGGQPGSSPANPLWVRSADLGVGGLLNGGSSSGGGLLGGLFDQGGIFGGGGFFSNIFSSIGGLFGFATGGSFVVGGDNGATDSQIVAFRATRGEEVSVKTPSQQARDRAQREGEAPPPAELHLHLHGVQDYDSFKRSKGQIAAGVAALTERAQRRNGG